MEDLLIHESNIHAHMKRKAKFKKEKGSSSTTRGRSKFEIVEVIWRGYTNQILRKPVELELI